MFSILLLVLFGFEDPRLIFLVSYQVAVFHRLYISSLSLEGTAWPTFDATLIPAKFEQRPITGQILLPGHLKARVLNKLVFINLKCHTSYLIDYNARVYL